MKTDLDSVYSQLLDQGVVEIPNGSNHAPPITEWYYNWSDQWCAMTCSFCAAHGGFSDDNGETLNLESAYGIVQTTHKGWAYVPYVKSSFQAAGLYVPSPAPGDWGIVPGETHIYYVATVDGDYIHTIEGNYNNKLTTNLRYASKQDGFCRLPYRHPVPTPDPIPDPGEEVEMVIFGISSPPEQSGTWLLDNGVRYHLPSKAAVDALMSGPNPVKNIGEANNWVSIPSMG